MVFCDVTFRKAVTLVLSHGHRIDEGSSFGDALEMTNILCIKNCKYRMKIHLQGFFATMCGKPCGRYQGTHWKSFIAFVKPHSNLQLVREYSLWKRRISDSSLNLQPLFSGARRCMVRGQFPEPKMDCLLIGDSN